MGSFCKNEDCPTSELLLEFQSGDMAVGEGVEIRKHLAVCEFCSAEVAFYAHYPQADDMPEPIETAEMPQPLFELAEAILTKRSDDDFFDRLMDREFR